MLGLTAVHLLGDISDIADGVTARLPGILRIARAEALVGPMAFVSLDQIGAQVVKGEIVSPGPAAKDRIHHSWVLRPNLRKHFVLAALPALEHGEVAIFVDLLRREIG